MMRIFSHCRMWLFITCLFAVSPLVHAGNIKIVEIKLTGLTHTPEKLVRSVLPFKPGDLLDMARVDQTVGYLRRWGIFDAIRVRVDTTHEGVVLTFVLDEATIITLVDIAGNYPFIKNRIVKHLTIHAGDMYTPKVVEEQVERIKEFYARQGFVGTTVSVEATSRPTLNGVDVTFRIHRGNVLRYRRIDVSGNHAYPKGRFVSALNPLRFYSEHRLHGALRDLTNFYRNNGYPRARLRILDRQTDFDHQRVDVKIDIQEGPHVVLHFKGNRKISDRSLKKIVTLLREGSIDSFEIDTSREAIRSAYEDRGYPHARISVQQSTRKDGTIDIAFVIDEGVPQFIKQIRFVGNHNISSKKLKHGMINRERATGIYGRYREKDEAGDNEAITQQLRAEGFLEGRTDAWKVETTKDPWPLIVTIPIEEGSRTLVSAVTFTGNQSAKSKDLLKILQVVPDTPLNQPALPNDIQTLLLYYADHGHPYAEVRQSVERDSDATTAVVHYDIVEGTSVTFGSILIVGDIITSQKAITKAMGIRPGDPYSATKVREAQLRIRRLGPFVAVDVETMGLEEKEDVVNIRVKVDEQAPFLVDLEFGYSTDQLYTGALTFTNLNAFGWAKRNSLTLVGGQKLSRVELGWVDPRFLGSSFEMATSTWLQYKQNPVFTYTQIGGAVGWFRRLHRFGLLFRFELDRNYFLDGSSTAADAESLRNNTIARSSLSLSYDSRDSFSDPREGFYTIGGVDIFNEIRGAQANFAKLSWSGENDLSPFRFATFSTALRFQRIQEIGTNISVPSNELLLLGGDDTIRGFDEDSIGPVDAQGRPTGGRIRWIANEELRLRIATNFTAAVFYDAGQLAVYFSDFAISETRHSVGFGLRYTTPVGPIRAEYGFKLNQRPGEPLGRFHLTFGYVF